MTMIDVTPIFNALITLLAGLITAFVIPWLKARLTAQQQQNAAHWAAVLVAAAEQMFTGTGRGEEKLKWVEVELARKGYTLDTAQIRALIEAQVYSLMPWKG
jgi:type II secretory pathway pseudopilin PulG